MNLLIISFFTLHAQNFTSKNNSAIKTSLFCNVLKEESTVPKSITPQSDAATFMSRSKAEDLCFTENRGQVVDLKGNQQPDVLFTAHTHSATLFLSANGISYQFSRKIEKNVEEKDKLHTKFKHTNPDSSQFYRLDVKLIGANLQCEVIKENEGAGVENFYLTQCPNGILNVKNYSRITYKNIYPNINWVVYTKGNALEYDFVVNPGGRVSDIKLQYNGAERIRLDDKGIVNIETPLGSVSEHKPVSFQAAGKEVQSKFVVKENILGFAIKNYDKRLPLIIDPEIVWATYYGGSNVEIGYSCTTDTSGNVYISGVTESSNNIAAGGFQNSAGGSDDAFLAKFNALGTRIWATYYGGNDQEESLSCATDLSGNIYMTGFTYSANNIAFNGFKNTYSGGNGDAFLVKFDSSGSRLWATYYGGNNEDVGSACITDILGNVYLVGGTKSVDSIAFNGFQNTYGGGNYDAFLVKFNSSGSRLWATYYGGESYDAGQSCSVDVSGNVYMSGTAYSANGIAIGGFQDTIGGNDDAFLVKFSASGKRKWGTYYGGNESDEGYTCNVDKSGNIYMTGFTASANGIAANGFQNTYGGGDLDAFLVKFSSAGLRQWGTYYGGSNNDNGSSCATDHSGNVYLVGGTNSTNNIAFNGFQNTNGGGDDAFLAKFNSSGVRLSSTYYGGNGAEGARSCTIDSKGNVYIAGSTNSTTNIAFSGFQNTFNGGLYDAFLAKISNNSVLPLQLISFTATLQNKAVNIVWQTEQEINTAYFVVEKSNDGINYYSIQQVPSIGSNIAYRYIAIDNNPFINKNLYRLKIVDKDGQFTYSNTISVAYIIKNLIVISPNPASAKITVQLQTISAAKVSFEIRDVNGKLVYTKQVSVIPGVNTLSVPVSKLAQGTYLLSVLQGNDKQTIKWAKE